MEKMTVEQRIVAASFIIQFHADRNPTYYLHRPRREEVAESLHFIYKNYGEQKVDEIIVNLLIPIEGLSGCIAQSVTCEI